MSRLVMTSSRSEKDGVVSVPTEGSIASSVSSIVDMIRSCVGWSSVGGCVSVTAGRLGISTKTNLGQDRLGISTKTNLGGPGSHLETVQLILQLHLSGLSHQSGHSVDWQSLTNQG